MRRNIDQPNSNTDTKSPIFARTRNAVAIALAATALNGCAMFQGSPENPSGNITEAECPEPVDIDFSRYYKTDEDNTHHLDQCNNPIYDERYDHVDGFENGFARVILNGEEFHISPTGKPIYSERYKGVNEFNENGVAKVHTFDGKIFFIRTDGTKINEKGYDVADRFDWNDPERYGAIEGKLFHLASDGSPMYDQRFDEVWPFKSGIAIVRIGAERFYIKPNGERVTDEKYDEVFDFCGDYGVVRKDWQDYHINKKVKRYTQQDTMP